MTKPKIFVGSSKKNVRIAGVLGEVLEEQSEAEVIVWHEGIFGLNHGVLETLLESLEEFDFAVLVLAADDVLISKDQMVPSTRDNVLFECGLFMGRLGRDRVFVAYDESIGLKIPSDLAGITLAPYDGARILSPTPAAAVRKACRLISEAIKRPALTTLVGQWRTRYRLTAEFDHPLAEDEADIVASAGGVCITNKKNTRNDYYVARASLTHERFLVGKWKAVASSGSSSGAFLLTVTPRGNLMYGYATGLSETSGTVYGTWVLAKQDGVNDAQISERLKRGEELLQNTVTTWQTGSDD